MLKLEHITKVFNAGTVDENTVFSDFNFSVEDGDFISLIGSNGSGKTTLLNLVCGSLKPDSGAVIFKGKDITGINEYKRARYIGRVFQDPKSGTCANLSILENMALADNKNRSFNLSLAVNKSRIDYYKSLLVDTGMGLENRMGTKVGSLSGGQRQALALVIANMTNVDLLILDEHTAALDPKSSETIMRLTDKLVNENHITTLMVTHNLRFAVDYGNRLVMMHEGRCVKDLKGEAKTNAEVEDLLATFNEISIANGN